MQKLYKLLLTADNSQQSLWFKTKVNVLYQFKQKNYMKSFIKFYFTKFVCRGKKCCMIKLRWNDGRVSYFIIQILHFFSSSASSTPKCFFRSFPSHPMPISYFSLRNTNNLQKKQQQGLQGEIGQFGRPS